MKKHTALVVIAAVLSLLVTAGGGYFFCTEKAFAEVELYVLIPIYLLLVLLASVLDELIHEGAHVIVGLICLMGVKPPKIKLFGSSSVEVFPYGSRHMRARMAATTVAGLVFDFLLIALGVISLAVPSVPSYFCVVLPYALYTFMLNVAPLEYKSGKTDGLVFWELISNKPTAQVMVAILKIQGLQHSGKLMRELDEGLFLDVPQLPEDDINFIILTQLRYEYYLAVGNDSEAYKYFLRYKDLVGYLPSEYNDESYYPARDSDVDT